MSDNSLEIRVALLERRVRSLYASIAVLVIAVGGALIFGRMELSSNQALAAAAQLKVNTTPPTQIVEANAFILKDKNNRVRGMWSADDDGSTFAIAHLTKDPSIVLGVSDNAASIVINDTSARNRITLGVNDTVRSLTMGSERSGNSVYLGLSNSESVLNIASKGDARISMSGKESRIESLGEHSSLMLAERTGNVVALEATLRKSALSFLGTGSIETFVAETVKGKSSIYMFSPSDRGKYSIKTTTTVNE